MNKVTKYLNSSFLFIVILLNLHYWVYLSNANFELWYLEWYSNTPIDLPGIILEEEKRPTYLFPLQKLTYLYYEVNNPKNIIIQENQSVFFSNMEILAWRDIVNKYFKDSWYMFITWFASNQYPSILYFIIFYFLLWGFINNIIQILILKSKIHYK
jgi:hypothetical protein